MTKIKQSCISCYNADTTKLLTQLIQA